MTTLVSFRDGVKRFLLERLLAGTVLLTVLGIAGCGDTGPKAAPPKPPEVLVAKPVLRLITDHEDFPGRTEAVESVEVRARVTGYLDKVLFKEGGEVNRGDPLAEIDQRTYKADLEKVEGDVARFEATLRRLDRDLKRGQNLLTQRAISQEDFDKIFGDRSEADASVRSAKAARERALLDLTFTNVIAPISGRISKRNITPGNLVMANDTILTTIVSLDPIYASFDIDERTLLRLRRLRQAGKIKSARDNKLPLLLSLLDEGSFYDDKGYPRHEGYIEFIDNKVDPQTGTLHVRGEFPNPNRLLSPGLFVRLQFPVGDPHKAVLLAEQALGTDQGRKFVYVVVEEPDKKDPEKTVQTAVYRQVKVGTLHEGMRVIEEGLTPDDVVIVTGLQRVRPGVEVKAKNVDMPMSEAAARLPLVIPPESRK